MVNDAGEMNLGHTMLRSLDFVPLKNFKKECGMIRFAFQKVCK